MIALIQKTDLPFIAKQVFSTNAALLFTGFHQKMFDVIFLFEVNIGTLVSFIAKVKYVPVANPRGWN